MFGRNGNFARNGNPGAFTGWNVLDQPTDSLDGPFFGVGAAGEELPIGDGISSGIGSDFWSSGFGGGFLVESANGSNSKSGSTSTWSGRQSLFMALKVGMLQRSWASDPTDSQISVLGKTVDLFRLVGLIRQVRRAEHRLSFLLDDSTGLISCDLMIPECPSPAKLSLLQALERNNQYVKVYGGINLLGKSEPHVRVHKVRIVEHADEITYHDLDVMYEIMRQKYKSDLVPYSVTNNTSNSISQKLNQVPLNQQQDGFSMSKLVGMVHSVLNESRSPLGSQRSLNITQIMRIVQQKLPNIRESAIREALAHLEGEALVCQTIDCDTYASTGA